MAIVGGRRLWREAVRLRARQVIHPSVTRALEGPRWGLELAMPDLAATLAGLPPAGFYDENLASSCWDVLRMNPWVDQVVWVRRSYPDRLRAAVLLRRPVAAVPVDEGTFAIVDAGGLRLPGTYGEPPAVDGRSMPVLEGAGRARYAPGEVWGDRVVVEGAAVAADLGRTGLLGLPGLDIRRIDLRNVGGRLFPEASEVLLETRSGVMIAWGRSSRSPRAATEPVPSRKAEILRAVLEEHPGLRGVRLVKVYLNDPAVLLVSEGTAAADPHGGG